MWNWLKTKGSAMLSLSHEFLEFGIGSLMAAGLVTGLASRLVGGMFIVFSAAVIISNIAHIIYN